ncbi:MAG: hypothetical protein AAB895_03800 [Patescibacteria group bacterium]
MKPKIKQKAVEMRSKGYSVKDISEELSVAKGSVSTWVRDITLTSQQKLNLKRRSHSPEVVEKRRQSRLKNESYKKSQIIDLASREIRKIDHESLKILGLGLYWGEGAKTSKGMARISNSDPFMIMMGMRFFREICKVEESRFRAHIHVHSTQIVKEAEKYWSEITKIPLSQFFKTYAIKSKSSKNLRKTLKYGTLDVGVGDTKLLLRILGWIEGLKKQLI